MRGIAEDFNIHDTRKYWPVALTQGNIRTCVLGHDGNVLTKVQPKLTGHFIPCSLIRHFRAYCSMGGVYVSATSPIDPSHSHLRLNGVM